MNFEELNEFLQEKLILDPYWADTESTIRQEAVRIQRELKQQPNGIVEATVPRHSPDYPLGVEYIRVTFFLTRYGGMEELLLIEEQLRRAING